jgi:hypothetical protein
MATNTMPLTFSPPRLLHRHRRREAKPQRRSATGVSLLPRRGAASAPRRLYCAPSGGGEVSAPPADEQQEQAAKEEKEEYTLLAITGSDFNEVIMIIDSPATRYLLLDTNRTYCAAHTAISSSASKLDSFGEFVLPIGCLVQGMFTAFSPRPESGPTHIGYRTVILYFYLYRLHVRCLLFCFP